jgi:hypothetical protein
MKFSRHAAIVLLLVVACLAAGASEGSFDRTLKVSGHVTLHVLNNAGNIRISVGAINRVSVHGQVSDTHPWGTKLAAQDDRLHEIAGNPPIRQTGNTLQVGPLPANLPNMHIDYEIEAPANTILDAATGMGDIVDEGVGETARLITRAGNINASGMLSGFSLETRSGDIVADGGGVGDIWIRSGSGSVELHNILGSLDADTDSGNIRLDGQPKSNWHIATVSGNVEYWANRSPLMLEASTSSGGIHVEGTMETIRQDKRSLTAKLHGGGPSVRIETGSGEIRVH